MVYRGRVGSVLNPQLIEAAKSGDRHAWKELIEATQSRLFRFCLVLCGDPAQAEDLCQQAYLKVYTNLSKLQKNESFMDWLFRSTRNLYIDAVRAKREQSTEILEDMAAGGEFSQHLEVHQILSHFKPEDRLLLVLVDMEEHSYKDAGLILGISEDAVRSRVFRLRKEFLEKWNGRETK